MYGCYIVMFAFLRGITSCGVFAAKDMPILSIDDPGKMPYYVTRPAKINQILVGDGALQIGY